VSGSGADDGADGGEQVGAPHGAETAGDLAVGRGVTQCAFAAVVVGVDLGVGEEREQVAAVPGDNYPERSASIILSGWRAGGGRA
jgi:hypothetical protein